MILNSSKIKQKLLSTDGEVDERNCFGKVTRHFFSRKVCSKNRNHAKDIDDFDTVLIASRFIINQNFIVACFDEMRELETGTRGNRLIIYSPL